jgi:glycosyltransferase involved in cell wall biosynthesis
MKEHSAGRFVPVEGYEEWSKAVLEILDKKMPRTLDIGIAREAYDWSNVARRFVQVYDDLVSAYYGAK